MTQPVRVPENVEEPPPSAISDGDALQALVAGLIAGVAVERLIRLVAAFPGLGVATVTKAFDMMPEWRGLAKRTADDFAILERDASPVTAVLREAATVNAFRRAAYLVNANRRVASAVRYGQRDPEALERALRTEQRHLDAHEAAERKRTSSAIAVAEETARHGTNSKGELLLGWHAVLDSRTSADCRWAHGRNFNALRRPRIGYPGEVHLHCRCTPRRPWDTRKRVEIGTVPTHD